MTLAGGVILATALVAAVFLLLPSTRRAELWRATATPLASIIGSGFLVLGPILVHGFGIWATAAMAGLCLAAWGFGDVMRENIRHAEGEAVARGRAARAISVISDIALAGAYVVSVAYYLNLFGAFGVKLTPFDGRSEAQAATTAALLALLAIGWSGGFRALEKAEMFTVSLKLAVIAALIAGLAIFVFGRAEAGALIVAPEALGPIEALTLGFGLIVTVQGFETSRYLGATYDAETRIRSMRLAQLLASAIYLAYVALLSVGFEIEAGALTETTIIDLVGAASAVLPPLLVLAALAAQASAAIADAGGAGGLAAELTKGRVPARGAYAILVGVGVALTWGSDIFSIIGYASRAFAVYYALQSALACRLAFGRGAKGKAARFAFLGALGLAAALFGREAEGGG